ncbi:MAG: hypothetical protein ABI548_01670 [Polyangiaceae bacterium]
MTERNYTLQVMHAVCASNLPPELRHLLLTLALAGSQDTGVGLHGQETIGRWMGVSRKTVLRYFQQLDQLAAAGQSPVRVERRRRGLKEGRGRTSDEWRLVLIPVSASLDSSPKAVTLKAPDQSPKAVTLKPLTLEVQSPSHGLSKSQTRTTKVPPVGQDRRRDRRRDRRSSLSPVGDEVGTPGYQLKQHYIAELQRLRNVDAVFVNHAKVGKDFKQMADALGLEKGRELISRALGDEFARHVEPWELLKNANSHLSNSGPRKTNRAPVQGPAPGVDPASYGKAAAAKLTGDAE